MAIRTTEMTNEQLKNLWYKGSPQDLAVYLGINLTDFNDMIECMRYQGVSRCNLCLGSEELYAHADCTGVLTSFKLLVPFRCPIVDDDPTYNTMDPKYHTWYLDVYSVNILGHISLLFKQPDTNKTFYVKYTDKETNETDKYYYP